MVHFPGTDYRSHTSCMTEDQKYQGALYKGKKQKPQQTFEAEVVEATEPATQPNMSHHAYVEDYNEEYETYRDYQIQESDFDGGFPPEAPTPPSALPLDDRINVFDFMQEPTPNASHMDLPVPGAFPTTGGRQLVRFNNDVDTYVDPEGYMVDHEDNVQYGPGHAHAYETPVPKASRRKSKESEVKKDKKRKRLHIDTSPQPMTAADEVMTDAPPVLHSGLTGGLNRMMRPSQFPPSPDYSGADGDNNSPAPTSPLKKPKDAKPSKTTRTESFGSGLKALISGSSKPKASKKRKTKHVGDKKDRKERKERKEKKDRKEHKKHHHSGTDDDKKPKLIEYRPQSSDGPKEGETGAMVLYKPRSDLFLSFCTKGPDSERGCSVNKALKRFHRERDSSADSLGKFIEEKELWRSLRMRKNDRGEIVLFSIADAEE
ncbi:uncharacterized protein B0I36DRAFT_85750 [Microdochium trichocladiopsis]|uniref:Zinc finger C2H2 LYAR-type domain-containing protein n=1 Tax=Microdochium trichocladiopsis TaxID=1682393 RepID=A0A9P8YBC9_9PEZI|nr:uncharacterized protein B0I36DRAFT_85750 [Microdochium trichocladiopsis]KAH7034929.1 hypothetical protein B0I36DRAFT_85750 [Microdochium trichocladiopsis]